MPFTLQRKCKTLIKKLSKNLCKVATTTATTTTLLTWKNVEKIPIKFYNLKVLFCILFKKQNAISDVTKK